MVAIKSFPNLPHHKTFIVCDGVMEEYAHFMPDGTFSGAAGIGVHAVSRRFQTLEEAKKAMDAYLKYAKKYK